MFIGRTQELHELHSILQNDSFESVLIYGRRRIGKTQLIKKAVEHHHGPVIYYEAKNSVMADNLEGLHDAVHSVMGVSYSFTGFYDLCAWLFEQHHPEPIVLILDELPYMINSDPLIVSELRNLIDNYKHRSNAKLIVSGSYIDIMKSLIESNSETYGRFTHIIPLQPFDYYDAAGFYPDYTPEDKLLMYACFGGVAFFSSLIDPQKSAMDNILNLIVRKNAILQLEVENTISNETRKIPQMNSLISLIGQGYTKYSDLNETMKAKLGKETNVDYLLKRLLEMEVIRREAPINDKTNRKKTFYRFNDHLIEFYYRYIFPNASRNTVLSAEMFYRLFIDSDMKEHYLPSVFEDAARQFLIRMNRLEMIHPPFYNIGNYTYNDPKQRISRQFDVVTEDVNGYISYECKYTNQKIGLQVIHEEETQILSSGLDFYQLGFISKNGFTEDAMNSGYRLYTLNDFYTKQ